MIVIVGLCNGYCENNEQRCQNCQSLPDDKLLDSLVLGARLGAVAAPDELDVAAPVLVTPVVTALGRHDV